MTQYIAVIFGGQSPEHEVSLRSAYNIMAAMDKAKYTPAPVGIDKTGKWWLFPTDPLDSAFGDLDAPKTTHLNLDNGQEVTLLLDGSGTLLGLENHQALSRIEAAFPIVHGDTGEDGALQGLLTMAGIPYVGPDVLGAAVGMDKEVTKRLLAEAGIPSTPYLPFFKGNVPTAEDVEQKLGWPVFVKPANAGSSVGVSKAGGNHKDYYDAVGQALKYDTKGLIEQAVTGREIECAVMGNETPQASVPGEILVADGHEFYSYESKYIDDKGASVVVPADLTEAEIAKVQDMAIRTYKTLCCTGMARVDGFLMPPPAGGKNETGAFLINEINTLPGFTKISMYPMMWEASGLSYPALITRLIELAFERRANNG